jgi:hypothetical protein
MNNNNTLLATAQSPAPKQASQMPAWERYSSIIWRRAFTGCLLNTVSSDQLFL